MNTEVKTNFAVKPLVAAVALALSAVNAYAAPTPNQMPGAGTVTAVSAGATATCTTGCGGGGGVGTTFINVPTPSTITLAGAAPKAVIQWGGSGAPVDPLNPAGFNIGSNGKLTFASAAAQAAVLNIDASGNPSQIFGQLDAAGANPPAIFVANTNGIIVGSGGRIAAPNGLGLIGANLNNATAINEFTANNADPGSTAAPTRAPEAAASYIDVNGGQSALNINGTINGSLTTNTPASYILLVGGDITNAGNLYAQQVVAAAGMQAVATLHNVNSAVVGGAPPLVPPGALVPVKRLWNVDTGSAVVDGNLGGLPGNVEVGRASSSFVNTGSISANGGFIGIEASKNIRSGTAGSGDLLVGLFADAGVVLSTFDDAGKIELYNVVTGYTTGVTLPFLDINQQGGAKGDVTIDALTRASQPSSIYTTGDVRIKGGNVAIKSTINHEVYGYGTYGGDDLVINGTKSVTISADVGAANDVDITSNGPLTISGNVNSNTDGGYVGHLNVTNTGSGALTKITGNLTANAFPYSYNKYGESVSINVNGPLDISGAVRATGGYVDITNNLAHATTVISGPVFGGEGNVSVTVSGPLNISGSLTARDGIYYHSGGSVNITNNAISDGAGDATTITGWIYADRNVNVNVSGTLTMSGNVYADNDVNINNLAQKNGIGAATTINGSIYAGDDIHIDVYGALTIGGNINAGNDVNIHNFGLASGNTTTITGSVYGYDYVDIRNYGLLNSKLNISGNVESGNEGVHVVSYGDLQLGKVDASTYIDIGVYGLHSQLNGPLTARGSDGIWYEAPIAQTNVLPAAVLTAPSVHLEVRNFQGVNASGLPYTSASQKPDAQIVTDHLDIVAYGSVNAPIAGNTNWLNNAMVVAPQTPGGFIDATISAEGASFQAINLKFMGDGVDLWSGDTATPFEAVGLTTGTGAAGGLQGNAGSQMILQAEHNMFVHGGNNPGGTAGSFFQFPGGLVFKAGDSLTVLNPVYNAWTTVSQAFQGVFLEAPVINTLSYFATNGNSWVNWSTLPTGHPPNTPINSVYQITQPTPATFNFVINPLAPHKNTYSSEIAGGPINTCPIGFTC